MHQNLNLAFRALMLSLFVFTAISTWGQTTAFQYQGRLTDGGTPANGNYDLQFTLWDALTGGTQQPQPTPVTVTLSAVAVNAGVFTVSLDFGANALPGANRFLEITVRSAGSPNFTTLSPRQQISSAPYAIRTLNAGTANTLSSACVACVQDSQISSVAGSKLNGTIPVASLPPGSANYIQNTKTLQPNSNFSINGVGSAAELDAEIVQANQIGANTAPSGPSASLHVKGTGWFTGNDTPLFPSAGQGVAIGMNGNSGYIFALDYGANAARNLSLNAPGGNVGVGIAAPQSRLHVNGTSWFQGINVPLPASAGQGVAIGTSQTGGYIFAFDYGAFQARNLYLNSPGGNVGIGTALPQSSLHVNGTGWFTGNSTPLPAAAGPGVGIGIASGTGYLFAYNYGSNSPANLALNAPGGNVGIGTNNPDQLLTVNGQARIAYVPPVNGPILGYMCFDNLGNLLNCTTSSLRYKNNIHPFLSGLDIVRRLQPIRFNWKEGGAPDIGLGAEDVAQIAPEFTVTNSKGEVEGVKYERLDLLLINAVKEQQKEIERLRADVKRLQAAGARHNSRRNIRRR